MHDDMKNTTPDSHKKKRIVIGVSALLVAILAAGGAVAIYQHSVSAQLVEAKEACAQASETLRVARNKYDTLHDRDAAEAVKITGKQVEDGDTVTVLAAAYKETVPDLAACNVDGVDGLREATAQIDKDAAWYDTHTASLSKAVAAVNESHDAKTLTNTKDALSKQLKAAEAKYKTTDGKVQDDKTRKDLKTLIDKASKIKDGTDVKAMNSQAKQLKDLMGKVDASVKAKTDADRKAAEEQAQREAEAAAAAAQAQVQANSQAQQSYTAPQQSYTPTYTAPQAPQYTAPQQTAPVQPAKPNTGSGPVSGGHGCNEGNCSSTPDLGYIPR
jgi:type II secretory pathway pseudopilin PulG